MAFANLLADAGAALVAIHGRTRGSEDKRRDGAADLDAVAAVVDSLKQRTVPIPCLSNGNVRGPSDVESNLLKTGAAGIMVAEALLKDPMLFSADVRERSQKTVLQAAAQYLRLCRSCSGVDPPSAAECAAAGDGGGGGNGGSGDNGGGNCDGGVHGVCSSGGGSAASGDGGVGVDGNSVVGSEHCLLPMSDGAFYDGDVAAGGKWKTVRMSRPPDVPLADEYERYSNWWTNADTVKTHIRYARPLPLPLGGRQGAISATLYADRHACTHFDLTTPTPYAAGTLSVKRAG